MSATTTCYLLCFAPGIERGSQGMSSHYLGSTGGPVDKRIATHLSGQGSPIVRAAVERGLDVRLVATWPGNKRDERKMKNRKNSTLLCPHCRPVALAARRDARRAARAARREVAA